MLPCQSTPCTATSNLPDRHCLCRSGVMDTGTHLPERGRHRSGSSGVLVHNRFEALEEGSASPHSVGFGSSRFSVDTIDEERPSTRRRLEEVQSGSETDSIQSPDDLEEVQGFVASGDEEDFAEVPVVEMVPPSGFRTDEKFFFLHFFLSEFVM